MQGAMAFSLAFHIVGIVMWLGGLMIITRCIKLFSGDAQVARSAAPMLRRLFFGFVVAGLVVAACSGVYQLSSFGVGAYMKQGWFHTKLTLVLALLVVTFFVPRTIAKLVEDPAAAGKRAMALHGASGALLLAIVF